MPEQQVHFMGLLPDIEDDRTAGMCYINKYNEANKKVQVGIDQEKAQSEKDSHSKNRGKTVLV